MKVKELKSLLNNEMYYVDLNGEIDEFLRIDDDYINGNNESLFIDFGDYVVKNLKAGIKCEGNKPVACLEIIEIMKGEVGNMKKATIKINVGEPTQIGDKIEIPLLVKGKEIKKIIATIGEDDKLHVEELLKSNMEFKTNGSNIMITNEKGETIELDKIKNRIYNIKISKYDDGKNGISTVLSFEFINDLYKTRNYFNVGDKYSILMKDTIIDEYNNLIRSNDINELGELKIIAYNEKCSHDNIVISEIVFKG